MQCLAQLFPTQRQYTSNVKHVYANDTIKNQLQQTLYGTYVQVHEQHNNSLQPRTAQSIALHPNGNAQGWITTIIPKIMKIALTG